MDELMKAYGETSREEGYLAGWRDALLFLAENELPEMGEIDERMEEVLDECLERRKESDWEPIDLSDV